MPMTIRPATETDIPALTNLSKQLGYPIPKKQLTQ